MDGILQGKIDAILQEFNQISKLESHFFPCRDQTDLRFDIDRCNWFCAKIAASPAGCELCTHKRLQLMEAALRTRKPHFSECHAGIGEFIVPCYYNQQLLGLFVTCTVPAVEYLPNVLRHSELYQKQYNISREELLQYLDSIPQIQRRECARA